jgi:chromosome segregation ATPase
MRKTLFILSLFSMLLVPAQAGAVDRAPRISDREIVERLTVLEEGLQHAEESLRAEIQANREAIGQLRTDMERQTQQLRDDMNTQFDRMFQLTLGILATFAAIVASTIGFAIWDRRTMIRPFETKVKEIEEELSQNRQRLHSFLEALQSLGQSDERVAEVLKKFNLF